MFNVMMVKFALLLLISLFIIESVYGRPHQVPRDGRLRGRKKHFRAWKQFKPCSIRSGDEVVPMRRCRSGSACSESSNVTVYQGENTYNFSFCEKDFDMEKDGRHLACQIQRQCPDGSAVNLDRSDICISTSCDAGPVNVSGGNKNVVSQLTFCGSIPDAFDYTIPALAGYCLIQDSDGNELKRTGCFPRGQNETIPCPESNPVTFVAENMLVFYCDPSLNLQDLFNKRDNFRQKYNEPAMCKPTRVGGQSQGTSGGKRGHKKNGRSGGRRRNFSKRW